jgi:putative ABC transport system permease protein
MILSYCSLAWRRLAAYPAFSSINILGLAVGMCCFVLAMLYVEDEYSYDRFWSHEGRIFLVETEMTPKAGGKPVESNRTYPQVAPLVASGLSVAQSAARLLTLDFLVSTDHQRAYDTVSFVDPEFAEIFDVRFITGSAEESLGAPMTAVLTESFAHKYFGDASPIGQAVTFDGKFKLRVAGVIEDLPRNTHLQIGILSNTSSMESMIYGDMLQGWRAPFAFTYLKLAPGESAVDAQTALMQLVRANVPEDMSANLNLPLTEIGTLRERLSEFGGINTLPVLLLAGALVLIMACINTVNLTTARGGERTRELGVRKALGGTRRELVLQFLAESIVTAVCSLVLALILVQTLLPAVNRGFEKELSLHLFSDGKLLLQLLGVTLATAVLAGGYPAFILSRFKAVDAFRGDVHFGGGAAALRTGLVVLQFLVAITLSIATCFVYLQMAHIRGMSLGFDKDNILVLQNIGWTEIQPRFEALRTELLRNESIQSVSGSYTVPGREFNRVVSLRPIGADDAHAVALNRIPVDYDFFKTYGVDLVAGRMFSRDYVTDAVRKLQPDETSRTIFGAMINESAAKRLGFSDTKDAVGQVLASSDPSWPWDVQVIGVVKDFHILAGRGELNPYVYIVKPDSVNYASIRIQAGELDAAVEYIDDTWNRIVPEYPIVRYFLDDHLESAFGNWVRNARVMVGLSVLAILIAVLGSVGLAAYSTKCRRREIGVRKVLGATAMDLTWLLSWDFAKPVLLANLLAWPLAYYLVRMWLDGYAYRVTMSTVVFVAAAILSLVISGLVVSFHTLKAARTNPAVTFRHL